MKKKPDINTIDEIFAIGRAEQAPAEEKPEPKKKPSRKPELRNYVKTETRKNVKRKAVITEGLKWADTSELVTIGAKAPAEVVTHWAIEAKRQKRPMSQVIIAALIDAFGVPEGSLKEED